MTQARTWSDDSGADGECERGFNGDGWSCDSGYERQTNGCTAKD